MKKRILSIALAAAMLASAFSIPASAAPVVEDKVLLHYTFDDVKDGVIKDVSGHGRDGSYDEGTIDIGDGSVELFGDAAVNVDKDVLAGTTALTLSFFINQPEFRMTTNLLSYGPDKDHLMTVLLGHDEQHGPRFAVCNGSEADHQTKFLCDEQIEQGEWTLVTFTIDEDGTLTRYIDGMMAGEQGYTDIFPGDIDSTEALFRLGGPTAWNDPYYVGEIGDFKIIDRALTEDEVFLEALNFAFGGDGIDNGESFLPPLPVIEVKLDKTSADMTVGETLQLNATVDPVDADDTTLTWTSSDASVATVANGKVTAVKAGTADITAEAASGAKAVCKVTVKAPAADNNNNNNTNVNKPADNKKPTVSKKASVKKITIKQGKKAVKTIKIKLKKKSIKLKAAVTGKNLTKAYKKISWTTSKKKIATVSSKGVVKLKKKGTVKITAKNKKSGKKATVKIIIK